MKNRYIYLIALATLMCLAPAAKTQNGFNIPFSQYGIGLSDMPYNMPSAFSMGGAVFSRSSRNIINPFNPASYAAIENESFVFDIGLNIQSCVLRNDANRLTDADGNLAYFTIAFPITGWWKTSAGLLPYSTVNYESVQTAFDIQTQSDVKTIYAGHGGVSQIYWGNAFNIGQRLSLGFNLNFTATSHEPSPTTSKATTAPIASTRADKKTPMSATCSSTWVCNISSPWVPTTLSTLVQPHGLRAT